MDKSKNLIKGAAAGAGFMYFFDPQLGRRRRSLARDQFVHSINMLVKAANVTWRDAMNRLYGTFAETRSALIGDEGSDDVIVARVRSKLGRYSSHPSIIEVSANNGTVTLSGPILADEMEEFVNAVKSIRGVKSVENHLEAHSRSENFPGLLGVKEPIGEAADIMQDVWSPTTRAAAGAIGGLMLAASIRRRRPGAFLFLGATGLGMILRAITNVETTKLVCREENEIFRPKSKSSQEKGQPSQEAISRSSVGVG